ncbi:MAG: class I SAM-dependent methyltransferase [Bacteroidetes bacterium]|nr:class I SAM-dependent methyltransferase [Bacteroidota bacterium]
MNIFAKFILQAKKPTGLPGLLIARFMNIGHNKLTNWGLSFLAIKEDDIILDIGCGGGRTVNKLAKTAGKGKVHGIDFSDASVKLSSKLNRDFINLGKVNIQKASVSSLPFPDNFFDIVTAVETYFFWPDLENDMKEVLRVIKPKGKLLIVSEVYKNSENEKSINRLSKISNTKDFMQFQTKEEFKQTFINAGYKDVKINDNIKHGWICGIGTKL